MFVLPLGLGTRWPKIPVVTLAIAAVLILCFLFEDGQTRSNEASFHLLSHPSFRSAKERLFLEHCRSRKEPPKTCAEVVKFVAPDFDSLIAPVGKKPRRVQAPQKMVEIPPADEDHYLQVLSKFEQELAEPSAAFKKFRTYPRFDSLKQDFHRKTLEVFKREHVLSRNNIGPDAVAMAQVRHGGWDHLIGNLLCFIAFGIYVEQRLGGVLYLFSYVLTGSLGLLFNSALFLPADLPLLGASANISGVMGLFYVFFFHSRMRFFIWFGLSRRLWAPVKYAFPLVFVVSDLAGALQSLVPSNGSGSVAHFAHLGGLVSGMAIAWVVERVKPLPSPFIYESEIQQFREMQADRSLDGKIQRAVQMLEFNLDNAVVRGTTLEAILSRKSSPIAQSALANKFMMAHLDGQCSDAIRLGKIDLALRVLRAIPLNLPFEHYLGSLSQMHNLLLADAAVAERRFYLALRLYDAFLLRWGQTSKEPSIRLSVASILAAMPGSASSVNGLQVYLNAHPNSMFQREFSAKISLLQLELDQMSIPFREVDYGPAKVS